MSNKTQNPSENQVIDDSKEKINLGESLEIKDSQNTENAMNNHTETESNENKKDETLREKFDFNNEEDFNKLLNYYAKLNATYYDGHKRSEEEVRRRKNINAQFKRIIDKKSANLVNQSDENSNFGEKIAQIEKGKMFSKEEMTEIFENKGAIIKLFKIMSSGVYEKDGEKIRLSQKQRCALALTLQKISEMELKKDSSKKMEIVEGKENVRML